MKLQQPDIKIKCNYSQAKTLYEYLMELLNNIEPYFKNIIDDKTAKILHEYNLTGICNKCARIMFLNIHTPFKKVTLKLNHAERFTLILISANYPLPMDINFIEYEIKNKLIK